METAAAGPLLNISRSMDAFDKTNDQGALEEYPSVNGSEGSPVVNQNSNLLGPADRDFAMFSHGVKEDEVNRKVGLENKGPVTEEGKSISSLKVYSRRKTGQIAKFMARLNLGPVLNEIGSEEETRKVVSDSIFDENNERNVHRDIPSGPLTPKQDPPHIVPIPLAALIMISLVWKMKSTGR